MNKTMRTFKYSFIFFILILSSACSVNPVTGEKQLLFTSKSKDIQIGQEQYKPSQQSQGGQYLLDLKLSAYIAKVGQKLASVSDQPQLPYEFVVLNNSVPNAWALPSGKIAINRGLLVQLKSEAQLAAVLSHEIVHAAARHGAQQMRDSMIMQAGMKGLGVALADNDYRSLIIGGAGLGAKLTLSKYSRDHESEADKYGIKYMAKAGYDLQAAVALQELFLSFSKNKKSSWYEGLFASHPPSQERVNQNKKNIQTFAKISTGKFQGEKEYQTAMLYLISKSNAYSLADKASLALSQNKATQALSLIQQAIKIEPREALFDSIKGDIYEKQGKSSLALKAHSKATKLNPKQFSYYLKRAQSFLSLGQPKKAEADFQKSMALLPTSTAAFQLGNLYQQQGKKQQAINFYTQAASAGGKQGEIAGLKIARLDIHDHPEKYLKVIHRQDPKGPLLVTFENHSRLDIKELTLISQLFNDKGKIIKQQSWKTTSAIKAGSRSRFYPVPVSYHLAPNERIQTRIEALVIDQ